MMPFTWRRRSSAGRAAVGAAAILALLAGCTQSTAQSDAGSAADSGVASDAGDAGSLPPADGGQLTDGGVLSDGGTQMGTCGTPVITSVTPPYGPAGGGTEVVLYGHCFANGFAGNQAGLQAADVTTIDFGSNTVDPSTVTVVDDTTITATVPPGIAGPADITLTNPNGLTDCAGCYTYLTPITITGFTAPIPPQGSTEGGTAFTLAGSGFAAGQLVLVGGSDATGVAASVDGSTISGVTPPGAAGAADVQVISAQTSATLSRGWVFVAPLTIASISPAWSPQAGGPVATITGSGFTPDDQVSFGATSAATTYVSATQLTAVVPPSTVAGAVNVIVTASSGLQATLANGFAYVPASCSTLQLYSVSPQQGSVSGGTCAAGTGCVQVVGCGFAAGLQIAFGPNFGNVNVSSACVAEVDLPAASAPGVVDVDARLVSGGNQLSASLPQAFAYVTPLTVTGITPDSGPSSAQPPSTATIAGTGLAASCQVTIAGSEAAVESASVDGTSLTVDIPPGPEGPGDVIVVCGTPGALGSQEAILPGGYTYVEPLNLLYISPDTGSIAGNTFVSLYGAGFPVGGTLGVTFGGSTAANIQVLSPHLATVSTPPGNVGFVDVTATSGGASSTLAGAYGYFDPKNTLGGSSGGPMDGTLNVTILNSSSGAYGQPVAGVTVSVDADGLLGTTDSRGEVTFSNNPLLLTPVDITASLTGYETASMEGVNAQNVTLYIGSTSGSSSSSSSSSQPEPEATFKGTVCGFDLPPSATAAPGSQVEAYVYFADPNVYSSVPFAQPDTPYIVSQDCGSWVLQSYDFGPIAIWAEVGVVSSSGAFTPYYMAVQRGLEAAPGVTVNPVALVMSTHLDQNVPVHIEIAATAQTIENNVYSYLDLGGEGVIPLGQTSSDTNDFTFPNFPDVAGTSVIFLDEAFGLDASGNMTYPVAFQYAEDDGDVTSGVTIGPMPAFPTVTAPVSGGAFSGTLGWSFGAGPLPNVQQLFIDDDTTGTPLWSIVLPGDQTSVSLPASALQATLPAGTGGAPSTLSWTLITSEATQFDYDNMTNEQLGLNAWTGFTESYGSMTYVAP